MSGTWFSLIFLLFSSQIQATERSNQKYQHLSECPVKEMVRLDRGEDATVRTPPRNQYGAYNCFAQAASCLTEAWMWKHKKNKNTKIEDLEMSTMVATVEGLKYALKRKTEDNSHKSIGQALFEKQKADTAELNLNEASSFDALAIDLEGGGKICNAINAVSMIGSYCPRKASILETSMKSDPLKKPDQDPNQIQVHIFNFLQGIFKVQLSLEKSAYEKNSSESLRSIEKLKNMYVSLLKDVSNSTENNLKSKLKNQLALLKAQHGQEGCEAADKNENELIQQINEMLTFTEGLPEKDQPKDLLKNFIKIMAESDPLEALPQLIRALVAPECLDPKNEVKLDPKPFCHQYDFPKKSDRLEYKDQKQLDGKLQYFLDIARTQYKTKKIKNVSEQVYVTENANQQYFKYLAKLMNSNEHKTYENRMPVTEKVYNSGTTGDALRTLILPNIISNRIPVGMTICSTVLVNRWFDSRSKSELCSEDKNFGQGPHSVAVIGARPNRNGQGCQYLVRNSFGFADSMGDYNENLRRQVCDEWVQYEKRKDYSVQKSKTPEQIQAERDRLDCDNGNLWIDESALISNTYSVSVMENGYKLKTRAKSVGHTVDKNVKEFLEKIGEKQEENRKKREEKKSSKLKQSGKTDESTDNANKDDDDSNE